MNTMRRLDGPTPPGEGLECSGAGVVELGGKGGRLQRIAETRTTQGLPANLTVNFSGHVGSNRAF